MEQTVSILIPTFNRYESLKRAVTSALCQSYPAIEIIITDNSDNLETENGLKRDFIANSKIIYHKNTANIGAVLNWKKAVELSKGDFCVILPDDDYFINSFYIEDAVKILNKDNSNLLLTACVWGYNENTVIASQNQKSLINGFDFYKNYLLKYSIPTICNILRKKSLEQVDYFYNNDFLYSDVELWLKLSKETDISFYNIPSVYYSFHESNIVLTMSQEKLLVNSRFLEVVYKYWTEGHLYNDKELYDTYIKLVGRYIFFTHSIYQFPIVEYAKKILKHLNINQTYFVKLNRSLITNYILTKTKKDIKRAIKKPIKKIIKLFIKR